MASVRRMRRRGWMSAARKSKPPETAPKISPHFSPRPSAAEPVVEASAYIFDLEGTLVDTVLPSLNCWCQTLAEFGFSFRTADLHRYSGLAGRAVLAQLLPNHAELQDFILSKYNFRFRNETLPTIRPVRGALGLLSTLKLRGAKIALASTCDPEELAHYRACLDADPFVDAFVSGDDIKRGKPHPDVILMALARLDIANPRDAIFIGDTPYDAEAARQARVRSFGVLTGHFGRADLLGAGCSDVFLDPKSLSQALAEPAAA